MRLSQLVANLGSQVRAHSLATWGELDPSLTGVSAINQALPGTISYVDSRKYAAAIQQTQASALILPLDPELQAQALGRGIAWIAAPQPRLLFAQVLEQFYPPLVPTPGIHPTAVIDSSAQVGEGVYVGPYAVIGPGVRVGDGAQIYPQVVIYPQAQIGERCILHAGCVIHERTQMGADCIVHSGAVIGGEGFGFVATPTGWHKMPQVGRVVLGQGVEIGCHSAVDRPALGETRIGQGTKIDNLVQVGHGCQIGQDSLLCAQVGLAGRVNLGQGVVLAGQVGIATEVSLGDRVTATARAGIISDIPTGSVVSGHPAVPHRQWLRTSALQSRLPEIYQALRRQGNPDL